MDKVYRPLPGLLPVRYDPVPIINGQVVHISRSLSRFIDYLTSRKFCCVESWMVKNGKRKIGLSYIHMMYFVLEPLLLA
ncbi:hypothetical protein YC2023_095106 [Brassica napus]